MFNPKKDVRIQKKGYFWGGHDSIEHPLKELHGEENLISFPIPNYNVFSSLRRLDLRYDLLLRLGLHFISSFYRIHLLRREFSMLQSIPVFLN
ncbi:MAG: hypothetical protein WCS86_00545 [Candidatus Paceibacterota bacterium]